MIRSHRYKTFAHSSLLDFLVFAIDELLRATSANRIRLFDHDERWVTAIVIVNVFKTSVGCK
jgi:hypothetical protein